MGNFERVLHALLRLRLCCRCVGGSGSRLGVLCDVENFLLIERLRLDEGETRVVLLVFSFDIFLEITENKLIINDIKIF